MAEYTTKLGDTWDVIAYAVLGNERYTPALISANPDHVNTVIFAAGVSLVLPTVNSSDNSAVGLPPWKRGAV